MLPLAPLLLVTAAATVAAPQFTGSVAGPNEVVVIDFAGPAFPGRTNVTFQVYTAQRRGQSGLTSSFDMPEYSPKSFGSSVVESLKEMRCKVVPGIAAGQYTVVSMADSNGNVSRVINVTVSSRNLPSGVGPRVYKVKLPD